MSKRSLTHQPKRKVKRPFVNNFSRGPWAVDAPNSNPTWPRFLIMRLICFWSLANVMSIYDETRSVGSFVGRGPSHYLFIWPWWCIFSATWKAIFLSVPMKSANVNGFYACLSRVWKSYLLDNGVFNKWAIILLELWYKISTTLFSSMYIR